MDRCKKCILRLHTVKHNEEGVCAYCQDHVNDRPWDAGRDEFIEMVKQYVGRGEKADVVVPITGGKDSVYTLYCVTSLVPDARVLAFTWDHGFHREQSWRNIKNAVKAAGVEHCVFRWGDDLKDARALVLEFHKAFGLPCRVCTMQNFTILKCALEHRIPLIVGGGIQGQGSVIRENGIIVNSTEARKTAESQFFFWMRVIGSLVRKSMPDKADRALAEVGSIFRKALKDPDATWPDAISLGYYFDWNRNEEEVLKTLRDDFQFEKPFRTMTHTSCELGAVGGYWEHTHPLKTGFFRRRELPRAMEFETSMVVRSGGMSREQGLRELELHGISSDRIPEDDISNYIQKVGITREEFDRYSARKYPPMRFAFYGLLQGVMNLARRGRRS